MNYFLCIFITFVISLVLIPLTIKFCKKYELFDPVNARKIHSGNVPRLGGVAITLSFAVGILIFTFILKMMPAERIIPLLVSGIIIFAFALADDLLDLPALAKLIVQLGAVLCVVISGGRFKCIFGIELPLWFSVVLTFGWTVGIINAFNLIDGIDGLCGTISVLILVTIGVVTMFSGDCAGIVYFMLAASVIGFLVFNWPPAKIFMGDCGSQFLGFMIAISPLYDYVAAPQFEYNKFLIMLVLVAIPMIDTVAAIWRRIRDGRSIMSADKYHMHHKLMNLGLSGRKILLLVSLNQLCLCIAVALSLVLSVFVSAVLLSVVFCVQVALFIALHYLHRSWYIKKICGGGYNY